MCKSGQRPVSFAGTNKSKIPNSQIEDPELARYVDVLRRRLIQLPSRPTEPTATLTPLVQATRHELWRIKTFIRP